MYTMVRQPNKMLVDGEYACPVHVAHLVQVSALLDLSVFYGCPVVGCSYRDRFTFLDVINGLLPDLGDRSELPTVCGHCGSDLTEADEVGLKTCARSECSYILDTIPIEKLTVARTCEAIWQAMARVAYREERERDEWRRLLFGAAEEEKVAPVEALVVTPAAEAMKEMDQEVERLTQALEIPPTPTLPDPDFLALFGPNPCVELGVPAAILATEKVQTLQKDPKVCICVGGRSRFCPAEH